MGRITKEFSEFYQEKLLGGDLTNGSNNLIVLDTNVLLDIVRLPSSIREQYIDAFKKVKDNLYIPYLVGVEVHFNKKTVEIDSEINLEKYNKAISEKLKEVEALLRPNFFRNQKIQDEIENSLKEDLTNFIDTFTSDVKKTMDEHFSSVKKSFNELIEIIDDKLGDRYEQSWIDEVQKEGEKRYAEDLPPGYDDKDKDEIKQYNISFDAKYGDLIIWKDILKKAKDDSNLGEKVIFITGDGESSKKNDLIFSYHGRKIGPRVALMNELKNEANKQLYITTPLHFIQLVNDIMENELQDYEFVEANNENLNEQINSIDSSGIIKSIYDINNSISKIDSEKFNKIVESFRNLSKSIPQNIQVELQSDIIKKRD